MLPLSLRTVGRDEQFGQCPQYTTSASSTEKPVSSEAVRQGVCADGAVDVLDVAARAAHDVVVVVPHPRFVARDRAGRLDAPRQAGVRQRTEHVVDRLVGDRAEGGASQSDDRLGVGVRMGVQDLQHRQSRSGDPQPDGTQSLLELPPHASNVAHIVEPFKSRGHEPSGGAASSAPVRTLAV